MANNDQDRPPPPRTQQPWVPEQPWDASQYQMRRNSVLLDQPPAMPTTGKTVELAATSTIKTSVTIDMEVIRAPFSEAGIAERLASDPQFYRRLAAHVASELRAYAGSVDTQGQANASHVIKGQVTDVADGFDEVASTLAGKNGILTPEAAQKAAAIISKVRDAYAALCTEHPALLEVAAIGLAGLSLHLIGGMSYDLAGVVSYAVIKKEKLADIFGGWKKGDGGPPQK